MTAAATWVLLAVVGAALPADPLPPPPRVALHLNRQPGALECPDQDALSQLVASRLGHNPFDPDAPNHVHVEMARLLTQWHATVTLRDAQGNALGERTLQSTAADCRELASGVAVSLSILLDAFAQAAPPPAPAQPAQPPPPQPPPTPPTTPSHPPPRAPVVRREAPRSAPPTVPPPAAARRFWGLELRAGAVTGLGPQPGLAAGPGVGAGVRLGSFSAALELHAPLGVQLRTGGVLASLAPQVAASACYGAGWLGGCVLGSGGALALALLERSRQQGTLAPLFHGGGRLFLQFPLLPQAAVRVALDVTAPWVFTFLDLDGAQTWRTPRLHTQASSWLVVLL